MNKLVTTALLTLAPGLAFADALPCDPQAASAGFFPGQDMHGMLAFEDQWPEASDIDFNDVVVTYNYVLRYDASNRVVGLRGTYNVLALGGTLDLGLGLALPVPSGIGAVIQISYGHGTVQGVGSTHALANPQPGGALTIHLVDNMRTLFSGQSGPVNAFSGVAAQTGDTIEVDVYFPTPVDIAITDAPFDVFIFRTGAPGHEIHLPQYGGTPLMDTSLFGTGLDGSTATRKFVDNTGLPYALSFPQVVEYPSEQTGIDLLYPDIIGFAASGGTQQLDFYTRPVASHAFAPLGSPVSPVVLSNQPLLDLAQNLLCPPPPPPVPSGTCDTLYASGERTSGTYTIDPDGANGPLPAQSYYCDFDSAGGWTNVDLSANRLYLANGVTVRCEDGLTTTANSLRCGGPYFVSGGVDYMPYHYYCNGSDRSADYFLTEVAPLLGHPGAVGLGFTSLTQHYTGSHPTSTNNNEYCYVQGAIYRYDHAMCRRWSGELRANGTPGGAPMNGNCTPSYFTLSF